MLPMNSNEAKARHDHAHCVLAQPAIHQNIERIPMKHTILTLTALLLAPLAALPAAETRPAKPNILLILADDLGYADIGCHGSEIQTPNLDRLAGNGLRFTEFYNAGRCCPTRASLLSGLYPHQAGIGHMTGDSGLPGYRGDLSKQCVTIAEVLRAGGYRTYMAGKWHVTKTEYKFARTGSRDNWPLQRGFDRFFGTPSGGGSYFDPATLTRDNQLVPPGNDFYYTDAIGENAARFVAEHDRTRPFFLYVAFTAPHWPLHAKPEDIAKYKGRYDQGWDALREERYQRQLTMGLIDKRWALSPRAAGAPAWKDAKDQPHQARLMEVYAAQVDSMDQNIGRILESLKTARQLDNTLILFLSDNGGEAADVYLMPASVQRPLGKEEIQYDLAPKFSRAGLPVRTGHGVVPGPADTYCAYRLPWANASDTPFRYFKEFTHEGGIATPLIAHWPAGIKRKGEFERQPGHLIDIMATCVDLAGVKYPAKFNGQTIQPMEGRSLVPAFTGGTIQRSEPLLWEHEGNRALRQGKWKLVAKGANGLWELYDLENDRTELHNLAAEHHGKAVELATLWEKQARRTRMIPWPWKPPFTQSNGITTAEEPASK